MTYAEQKAIQEEKLRKLANMTDSEKLDYAISLLVDSVEIQELTDCSDTHGIDYTEEWCEHEKKKEEFLQALTKTQ